MVYSASRGEVLLHGGWDGEYLGDLWRWSQGEWTRLSAGRLARSGRHGLVASSGGLLLYETFAQGNEIYGKPRRAEFLLAPGELLDAFATALQVIAYEHGHEPEPRPAVRQRLAATARPEPQSLWSNSLPLDGAG